VLGGRTLLLLHDTQGHPHLATTHRGDWHLTKGVSQFLARYDQATGGHAVARLIIDREGMAAEFLYHLANTGRTVVTILKSNQYAGLASFTDVSAFVPLCRDRNGAVTREVAPHGLRSAYLTIPGNGSRLPSHSFVICEEGFRAVILQRSRKRGAGMLIWKG
jgi:hypothetical protein